MNLKEKTNITRGTIRTELLNETVDMKTTIYEVKILWVKQQRTRQ